MGLYVEFETTKTDYMVLDLPDDLNLLEEMDFLELPKDWQDKEKFTISDLKKQSKEYQGYVCEEIFKGLEDFTFQEYEDYDTSHSQPQDRDVEILDYNLDEDKTGVI